MTKRKTARKTANRNSLHKRGESHWNRKLSERDVREIRALRKANIRTRVIAEIFGVSSPTVTQIANGHSWDHIR